jgi:acyl-CoA reductase-like NAD-dependent aldehyde dehydrogenase
VLLSSSYPEDVLRHESFGPLLLLQPVSGPEQGLAAMAASSHGLTAAVYSADRQLAEHMLNKLDVGTGFWNACGEMSAALPWSGRRGSGMGLTLGMPGLRHLTRPKSFSMRQP